ncbi:neutral and basic amino acid transport protein rBAT [Ixodes scapularis]|uniref:neutral and basic amino acid transport protein rBAT n=1 Tax=Ixodes scapularis TaxID=6945 RepID=UPI001A9D12FB|nr:neutral and basic amino acid transport protein rBAT [Ixodes scapularis]
MEVVENENYKAPHATVEDAVADGELAAKEKLVTATDAAKITFTNSKADGKDLNGDAKIEIQGVESVFVGLSKDELMKYANDPFWVRTRMALFVLFWLLWLAMLVGAIIIIVVTPRCASPPQLAWWQSSPVYNVEVTAFRDSNKDNTGDFEGLTSKLDYIKSLGMTTLLLNSIFPTAPGSGGTTDFSTVDEGLLGTLHQFEALVNATKERDMHLVLEVLPGFTDATHPWFASSAKKENGFDDLYVWRDGAGGDDSKPPNDWTMADGQPAWSWNSDRSQFFLHRRGVTKPDLNLRSFQLRERFNEILRLWLDRGVSGFLVSNLTEGSASNMQEGDIPEVVVLLQDWRQLLTNYSDSHDSVHRLLAVEALGKPAEMSRLYGSADEPLADLVLNGEFARRSGTLDAQVLNDVVHEALNATTAEGQWPSLVLGAKGVHRLAHRAGEELLDGLHMVAALLRGTPLFYYGDELGVQGDLQDPSKNYVMQWYHPSDSEGPSVTSVEAQRNETNSHLKVVQHSVALREKLAVRLGSTVTSVLNNGTVFTMLRVRKGTPGYLVVVNTAHEPVTVNLAEASSHIPESGHVDVVSTHSTRALQSKVRLGELSLDQHEALVLQFVPIFE